MIGGDYWEPHEFYQQAMIADRELRNQSLEVHRRNVTMSQAVSAAQLARSYPSTRGGLLASLGMMNQMPNSPYAALFSAMDLQDRSDEINGGLGPEGEQLRAQRAESSREVAAGDLPGLVRPPSLLSRMMNVPKSAVRGLFMVFGALYEETLSKVAFVSAAARQGIDPAIAWDQAPNSMLRMAISEWADGKPVNTGSNWFTLEGDLAPETQRRLEAGMAFEDAIDNDEQAALGVPLGHLWNYEQSAYQFYFRNGESVMPSPGSAIASEIFDANNWAARATSGVLDFVGMTLTDPSTILGGATAAGRVAATRLLPSGARGIGMTMTQYLSTPSAQRAIRGLAALEGKPVEIARAIKRAVPHGDRGAVADAISTLAGNEELLTRYLQRLNSVGVMTNTFEPISLSGYLARKTAVRNPNSLAGRFANRILDSASGSRIAMPSLGSNLAALGMRGAARRDTVRSMGAVGGFGAAIGGRRMYTPRMDRMLGGVRRVLSTTDARSAEVVDDYARSMMLTADQRNELYRRTARQPELRDNDAMARVTDQFLFEEYIGGNELVAREYGMMLEGVGGESPLQIIEDAHRMFADNMAAAARLGAQDAQNLRELLSRIFDGVNRNVEWMLQLNGEAMMHPLAKIGVHDATSGRRYVMGSPMDLHEALAGNIPLMDPRAVRMMLRRAGQLGIAGPNGHRLGIISGLRGDRGSRLIEYAQYLKGDIDRARRPLFEAIEFSDARRAILDADSIDDLTDVTIAGTPAIEWLELKGVQVSQWDDLKRTARTYADTLEEIQAKGFNSVQIDDADNMVFLDATGRNVLEAFADASVNEAVTNRGLLATLGNAYNGQEAILKAMLSFQSSMWKPLVMLRPAYVFRVVGEEQMRMWFNGYRGLFNSPISLMVLSMASRDPDSSTRFGRFLSSKIPQRWQASGKRLQQILGVPDADMAGELLPRLREFNDAMYRARQNAFIRGDVHSYVGEYRQVPFERVNGRITSETAQGIALEVVAAADSPARRAAAAALHLDLLDDPERVAYLLANDPDYAVIAEAFHHYGGTTVATAPADNFKEGFSGLFVRAFADRHAPPAFKRMRGASERLNYSARDALGENSVAAAHAQAYLASLMDTQGIRYVRRDINGAGLVTNAGQPADQVLDANTLRRMERQSAITPNEEWYMRPDVDYDGPVRMIPDERISFTDTDEGALGLLPSTPGERLFSHPQPMGDGRVGTTVVATDDAGNLLGRVTLDIDHSGGRQVIRGVERLEMTFGSEVKIGRLLENAIHRVDPYWMEGSTLGDLLDLPVNGKPLRDWFDDAQIQTSPVGIADYLNNPNFERMTVAQLLDAEVPGEYASLGEWLLQPAQRGRLDEDLVDRIRGTVRGPEEITQVEPGVFATRNGRYYVVDQNAEPMFVVPDAGQGTLSTAPPPQTPIPPREVAVEVSEWSSHRRDRVTRNADAIRREADGQVALDDLAARQAVPDVEEVAPAGLVDEVAEPAIGLGDDGTFDLAVDDSRLMARWEEGTVGGVHEGQPITIPKAGVQQSALLDQLFLEGDSVRARTAVRRVQAPERHRGRARGTDASKTRESFEILDVDYVREALTNHLESATTQRARRPAEGLLRELDRLSEGVETPSRFTGFAEQINPRTLPVDHESGLRIWREIPANEMTLEDFAQWQRDATSTTRRAPTDRIIEARQWPGDRIATRIDDSALAGLKMLLEVTDVGDGGVWHSRGFTVRRIGRNQHEIVVTDAEAFREVAFGDWWDERVAELAGAASAPVDVAENVARRLAQREASTLSWSTDTPRQLSAAERKRINTLAQQGREAGFGDNAQMLGEMELYGEWARANADLAELRSNLDDLRNVGRGVDNRVGEITERQAELTAAAHARVDEMMNQTAAGRKQLKRYNDALERHTAALAEIESATGPDAARIVRNAKKRAATAQRTMDEIDALRRELVVNGPETRELVDGDIEKLMISHREGKSPAAIVLENEITALEMRIEGFVSRGVNATVEAQLVKQLGLPAGMGDAERQRVMGEMLLALVDHWRAPTQVTPLEGIEGVVQRLLSDIDNAARPPRTTYLDLGAAPGDVAPPGYQVIATNGESTRVVESFSSSQIEDANDTLEALRKVEAGKGGSTEYSLRRITPDEAAQARELASGIDAPDAHAGGGAVPDDWMADELEWLEYQRLNIEDAYRDGAMSPEQYQAEMDELAAQLRAAQAEAGIPEGAPTAPVEQVDNLGDEAMGMGDDAFQGLPDEAAPPAAPEPELGQISLDDLPDESAFDPEAAMPVGAPDEGLPTSGMNVTVSYGDDAIVVKDGQIMSQLFTKRREDRVSEALARRLLAQADDMELDLTIATRDSSMWPRYEALGFEVVEVSDNGKTTMIRAAGTEIPDEFPSAAPLRRVEGPDPDAGQPLVRIVDEFGEVVDEVPPGQAEAAIQRHVDDVSPPWETTKDDLIEAYKTLHESDPSVYGRPAEALRAIDNSGEALVRHTSTPRPGFNAQGERLEGLPPGVPRPYWDTEMGPTAYFPLPDQPWDHGMLEAIARNRALGSDTLDDYVRRALDDGIITPEDAVTKSLDELAPIVAPEVRFDQATGRELLLDFDEIRSELMTDAGRMAALNRVGANVERFTNVRNWNPHQPGGVGKTHLRLPKFEEKDVRAATRAVNMAFDIITARPSNMLSRGPVWADAYTEAIADLYPFATPEVREKIIEYFRDVGLHGGNHEITNLAAAMVGRRNFAHMSIEQMEALLLSQSKAGKAGRVAGKSISRVKIDPTANLDAPVAGMNDWEQLNLFAQQIAAERVKELLFDASQRAQIFDQMAIIFPFGDAFAELMTRWFKAFATSPYRARNMSRFGRTLRAVNGGMHEDGGMFSDDAGLTYSDPMSGEQMLMFPWSRSLSSMVTGDDRMLRHGLNMEGLSPITTALVPGVGPIAAIGSLVPGWQNFLRTASVSPRDSWERRLYEQIFPFGMYDTDLERSGVYGIAKQLGVPAWAERLANGFANAWTSQNEAVFASEGSRNTMNNMMMGLIGAGAASGRYDLSTPQMQEAAIDDAMSKVAGIEMIRAMALALTGGNALDIRIGHMADATPQEIANLTDRQIDSLMSYMAPVAYNREYQRILEENDRDYVAAAVQFDAEFGFDPSYVRVARSVELKPTAVTPEGRIFQMANTEMFNRYDLAAYYLQPDPPASDFDYAAFRHGILSSSREQLSPQDWVYMVNNSIGMHEYAQEQRRLNAMFEAGQITRAESDVALRIKRANLREQFPGYDREPGYQRPDPRDVANQIHVMVTHEGESLNRYQMGKLLREADELIQASMALSRDAGRGEWYWATSPNDEAVMIRTAVRQWFEQKARFDPRVAILWNEVYGRILPSGDVARGSIFTEDPYFRGFVEEDTGYTDWLEEAG